MRKDLDERIEHIKQWIAEGQSKAFMCRELKCQRATLDSFLDKSGIVYKGNQGKSGFESDAYVPLDEYLKRDSIYPSKIKAKMLREGHKKHECEICKYTEWMGEPIPLSIDHIDGNHFNNDLDNLRIICFNCHAQTETFAGRSKGKKLS